MSVPAEIAKILQESGPKTSSELAIMLDKSRKQIASYMGRIKEIAVIESKTEYFSKKSREATYTFIKYIKIQVTASEISKKESPRTAAYIPKPWIYKGVNINELPKTMLRENMIDWYNENHKTEPGFNIKKLYELAKRHGITVYRVTDSGIKYLN